MEPSSNFDLQDGDILFQDHSCSQLCDAIENVTPGYNGAQVSHNGIYFSSGARKFVVEAIYPEVVIVPLPNFLGRSKDPHGRPSVFVGRLRPEYQPLVPKAIEKALTLVGLPYDDIFSPGEKSYYCSELIVDSFKHANNDEYLFNEHPMSFRDEVTGEVLEFWKLYFARRNMDVPAGVVGSNPGAQSTSEALQIVHRYGFVRGWA